MNVIKNVIFFPNGLFIYFWTNIGPKAVEPIYEPCYNPKMPMLAFFNTEQYWQNKTDNYIIGPIDEAPKNKLGSF